MQESKPVMKKPTIKQAMNCLELVCKEYKLRMTIHYAPKGRWVSTPGYVIKIMGKQFQSVDFIKAAGQAVEFVYNAHNHEDKTE